VQVLEALLRGAENKRLAGEELFGHSVFQRLHPLQLGGEGSPGRFEGSCTCVREGHAEKDLA